MKNKFLHVIAMAILVSFAACNKKAGMQESNSDSINATTETIN